MDINISVSYKSYPIPDRKQFAGNISVSTKNPVNTGFIDLNNEPFVEVEVNKMEIGSGSVSIPSMQIVKSQADETRMLFYSMRQIAWDNISFNKNNSKAFYYQAQFMKDFEDKYINKVPFSAYYPCYQMMDYEQLRTYFTWRTKVRKGKVEDTSLSYAFIYIYELLNNIGVSDPQDGLDRLMSFWQSFRVFDSAIDKYVLRWIKDYHIYYPLNESFRDFACNNNLQAFYPCVFGYGYDKMYSFDLFADISSYNIKNSIFYSEDTGKMIDECFFFILNRIRGLFRNRKKGFEDLVFYRVVKEFKWIPFGNALFYHVSRQSDRQIAVSDRETYTCSNSYWTYKTVIITEPGRKLIGYIMKEMESFLRKSVGFKHKLVTNPDMLDSSISKKLEKMGVIFPAFIQESVSEYYSKYTRKIITVDTKNLMQIRREALQTQEKLIVPEGVENENIQIPWKTIVPNEVALNEVAPKLIIPNEIQPKEVAPKLIMPNEIAPKEVAPNEIAPKEVAPKEVAPNEIAPKEVVNFASDVKQNCISSTEEEMRTINFEPIADVVSSPIPDIWSKFKEVLSLIELEALKHIIDGKDIKGFAFRNMLMPEVLADEINQKAMDCLGDTILEFDDNLIIYEDYKSKLFEILNY